MRIGYLFVLGLTLFISSCERLLIRDEQTVPYEGRVADPEAVYLSTYDADLFWEVFQAAPSTSDPATYYQKNYVDKGSLVLRNTFAAGQIDGKRLNTVTTQLRPFYESIQPMVMQAVKQQKPAIIAGLQHLKAVYKDALFPVIYFVVGAFNNGGKSLQAGVYIGLEFFSKDSNTVVNGLNAYTASAIRPAVDLDVIIAHEMVHQQQQYSSENTLLQAALQEGIADFVANLATGKVATKADTYTFGLTHEADIWHNFKNDMMGQDLSQWLYEGNQSNRYKYPTDLGYFVGYRIAQAYYEQQSDKQQAVYDMLHIQSFTSFLTQSQYAERF